MSELREIESYNKILDTFKIDEDQLSCFLTNENCCDGQTMWYEDQVAEDLHRITKLSMKKKATIWMLKLGFNGDAYFFLVPRGTKKDRLQDIIIERIKKKLAKGAQF